MKLQKTTLLLLAIALVLGGWVAIEELKPKANTQENPSKSTKIFDLDRKDIKKITIQTPKQSLTLVHTDNPYSPWRLTQPENSAANAAVVSYLVDLLVNAKSDRKFTILPDQKADFGLDKPSAQITVQLNNQSELKLILGKPDFKNEFIYAYQTSNIAVSGPITLYLVSKNFQFALDRDLAQWKAPSPPS